MTRIPIATMLLLFCISCGKDNDSSGASPPKFEEPDAFFQLLTRYSSGIFIVRAAAEIQAEADTIAIGRMVNIRKGTTYDDEDPNGVDIPSMVVDLEVRTLLKGSEHEGHAYYEQAHAPVVSLETFQTNMPQFDVLVFLRPAPREQVDGWEYADPTAGYPAGVTPRGLVNPQGLLYEKDGQVVQPLATVDASDDAQLYPNAKTLDEVAQEMAGATSQ